MRTGDPLNLIRLFPRLNRRGHIEAGFLFEGLAEHRAPFPRLNRRGHIEAR